MNKDVILTKLTEEDIELVRTWRNSPQVAKYMHSEDYITAEQQKAWFDKISKDATQDHWLVSYDDKKIGVVNLYDKKSLHKTAFWGMYMGIEELRGQGIGKKIEYNLISKFFDEVGYNKLQGEVLADNEYVLRLHENFGFQREGYFRQQIFKNGKYHDVVFISLLRRDWLMIKDYVYQKIYGEK